jgi:hypothetical protein
VTTKGGRAHTWNRAISRGVLTIRTIGWETVTRGGGCDINAVSTTHVTLPKPQLTAVATRATMGSGTSLLVTPSGPLEIGKQWLKFVTNDFSPVKNRCWIILMIRSFQYGRERIIRWD